MAWRAATALLVMGVLLLQVCVTGAVAEADFDAAAWKALVDAVWRPTNMTLRSASRSLNAKAMQNKNGDRSTSPALPPEHAVLNPVTSLVCYKPSGRALSNLFLIGAGKSGSTALWGYLTDTRYTHGAVRSDIKEVHFFNSRLALGMEPHATDSGEVLTAYSNLFPPCKEVQEGDVRYLMDATPGYLSNTQTVGRLLHAYGPALAARIKLLVVLRDPLTRTLSWFNHIGRGLKYEFKIPCEVSFSQWVAREVAGVMQCVRQNIGPPSQDARQIVYRCLPPAFWQAAYAWQLSSWLLAFEPSQFHIIDHHDLEASHTDTLSEVLQFLDLPVPENVDSLPEVIRNNSEEKHHTCEVESAIDRNTEELLRSFFSPLNAHLSDLLAARRLDHFMPQFTSEY
eukprot:jgi/Chlat1/2881/Chrsp2S04626